MPQFGLLVAGAVAISLASVGTAADSAPDRSGNDEVLRQIDELRQQNAQLAKKVQQLEQVATDEGAWLTEARATQIRSLVTDVLSDAAARSSLQADGATAGWNKGFFLASPDGSFRLNIKGQIQFRWAYNSRDLPSGALATGSATGPEQNWGFENRRTKLTFAGSVVDPSITFEIKPVWNRASTSGSTTQVNGSVEEIFIQKAFDGGFAVRAGQFKAPFLREELVSSSAQLTVERSLVNDVFTMKFVQGVQLEWEQEMFRVDGFYGDTGRQNAVNVAKDAATASNYLGSYNTDFQTNRSAYAIAARAEYKAAGTWKQFKDLTSYRGEEFGLLFGLAGMSQNLRPNNVVATTATNMWGVSGDVSVDFGGANLFMYGVYRSVGLGAPVGVRDGSMENELGQYGFVVQGGFFVLEDLELFARYEYGNLDTDQFRTVANSRRASLGRLSAATVGFNLFPLGAANKELKWTSEFGFAFTPVGDFASSGAGWKSDATTSSGNSSDSQFVVRSQLQLTF
ncbi:MAG: porin [Phycisphaerae bacterium]|nr:porin [Phycisphaerae bacterium]